MSKDKQINVLDHGFVRLVDHMGDDQAIVQAARVSIAGEGVRPVQEDRGLIRYLMRHRHSTPLEMCEFKFHAKMPIFVARQWVRHRTANINEMSARYSELPEEFYVPDLEDIKPQATKNKQGRDESAVIASATRRRVQAQIQSTSEEAFRVYRELLDQGVARELARCVLPVNTYTEWYWKIDLHNLFHFLSLRLHPHAQMEIRVYAEAMYELIKPIVPIATEAFEDYRLGGMTLSAQEVEGLEDVMQGVADGDAKIGVPEFKTKREGAEFQTKMEKILPFKD